MHKKHAPEKKGSGLKLKAPGVRVHWHHHGPYYEGFIPGQKNHVLTVFETGGQVWVQCIAYEGHKPWSRTVKTIAGGQLLGKLMVEGGKHPKDLESVYLDHVEEIDDLDAYEARMEKEQAQRSEAGVRSSQ